MTAQPPEWPGDLLNVAALRSRGAQPRPFRQFILKIFSRCNMACDYCYVYELTDQSWRQRPRLMPAATVTAAIARIAEHVRDHEIRRVRVILHGGEPLLAGPGFIAELAAALRAALPATATAEIVIQTNGTLLDETMLDVMVRDRIRVGVSVDGGRSASTGSAATPAGDRLCRGQPRRCALRTEPYRAIYNGLLCIISLENNPVETYEALLADAPPR